MPNIPGYNFEYIPTPLLARGAGMFIDKYLDYVILEKTSNIAFQTLWIEICFTKNKQTLYMASYTNNKIHLNNFKNIVIAQLRS